MYRLCSLTHGYSLYVSILTNGRIYLYQVYQYQRKAVSIIRMQVNINMPVFTCHLQCSFHKHLKIQPLKTFPIDIKTTIVDIRAPFPIQLQPVKPFPIDIKTIVDIQALSYL